MGMVGGGRDAFVGKNAAANTRRPAGHPEGHLEAFANIYRNFAAALDKATRGRASVKESEYDCPTSDDGVRGIAFGTAAVESSQSKSKWIKVK